jgi:hypothetical protein
MRPLLPTVFGGLLLAAVAARAQAQAPSCHGSLRPGNVAELIFGRDIGSHPGVGDAAWTRFAAREITPRFPNGFTVTDTTGQWRSRDSGKIVQEPSKHVEIVLRGNDDDQARLDAVAAAYKRQFHQQAVGIIVHSACVAF